MKYIPNKQAITVSNIVEQTWLTRYPLPQEMTYDRGTEFMAEFAEMARKDYQIKTRPITVRNPQANAIIERVHQTIGNIIRTFELHNKRKVTKEDIQGFLSSTMFAIRATYHTTLQATPMQLAFGRDAILNIKFEANWDYIKQRKQDLIDYNNKRENKKRIPHTTK
jgi:transposase InsO family protein